MQVLSSAAANDFCLLQQTIRLVWAVACWTVAWPFAELLFYTMVLKLMRDMCSLYTST